MESKCIACGKERESDYDEMCLKCKVGWLEHNAEVALQDLIDGYHKLLKLEKEKQDELPSSRSE